ncbi:MAG: type II toxin-antitoxin system RelE/ParE family toxin, partial [Tepidisphaeraceae bacterium]
MSYRIRLSPEARADLRQQLDFYEREQAGLGQRFVQMFVAAIEKIVDRPTSFPEVHTGTRRARIEHFPHGVFFRWPAPANSIR